MNKDMLKLFALILRPVRYPALDGMRAYAVFLVFMVHFTGTITVEYFRYPTAFIEQQKWTKYIGDGHNGVELFFLISGFLIGRMVFASTSFSYLGFVAKRFLRIYPAFLTSVLVYVVAGHHYFQIPIEWPKLWKNLLMLNSIPSLQIPPYNQVTWSLGYEFAFYMMIPAFLLFSRWCERKVIPFLVLVLAILFWPESGIRMIGLFAGACIAAFDDSALSDIAARVPAIPLLVVYIVTGAARIWGHLEGYLHWYFAYLLVGALLLVKVGWGDGWLTRLCSRPELRFLGTISYSVYLYHSIVISLVVRYVTVTAQPSTLGTAVYFLLSIAGSIAVSCASYLLMERWYFRARKNVVAATHVPVRETATLHAMTASKS